MKNHHKTVKSLIDEIEFLISLKPKSEKESEIIQRMLLRAIDDLKKEENHAS